MQVRIASSARSQLALNIPNMVMKKKYWHKELIRDRIPEKIKESGDGYKTRVLGDAEFEKELKKEVG